MTTALPAMALALLVAGCSTAASRPWQGPDDATWNRLRADLAARRARQAVEPWSAGIRMTLREPRSGRLLQARGAIAVAPGRAVRVILLGPAGTTVFDAWVTPRRWRVAVPVVPWVRRGTDSPSDLPVGFFRWLWLRPFAGDLFAASERDGQDVWLMHDGGAVIVLRSGSCPMGERLDATRRLGTRTERLVVCGSQPVPAEGDTAEYDDEATGLRVETVVESSSPGHPDPGAFVDPDDAGQGS